MTQPELIRELIEKLLAERDKNNKLQSKLEEYKKSKDQMCHTQSSGRVIVVAFLLLILNIKKYVHCGTHTSKQYTQTELEYIV